MHGDPTKAASSAEAFLASLDEPRRSDIGRLHERILELAPGIAASADAGMLRYGRYEYRYASGREGEWFVLGIASNKRYVSLYTSSYALESYAERLPKADLGRGCIRFKRLDDLDQDVLDEVIRASAANDGKRIVTEASPR